MRCRRRRRRCRRCRRHHRRCRCFCCCRCRCCCLDSETETQGSAFGMGRGRWCGGRNNRESSAARTKWAASSACCVGAGLPCAPRAVARLLRHGACSPAATLHPWSPPPLRCAALCFACRSDGAAHGRRSHLPWRRRSPIDRPWSGHLQARLHFGGRGDRAQPDLQRADHSRQHVRWVKHARRPSARRACTVLQRSSRLSSHRCCAPDPCSDGPCGRVQPQCDEQG